MNVDKSLYTVLLTLLHDYIEYLHTVFESLAIRLNEVLVDISVLAGRSYSTVLTDFIFRRIVACLNRRYRKRSTVHPREQKLSGNRKTDDIDAVVSNALQHIVNISCIESMRNVLGAVHTEPVSTCEPYFVAVHIVKAAANSVEPVVIIVISSRNCDIFYIFFVSRNS